METLSRNTNERAQPVTFLKQLEDSYSGSWVIRCINSYFDIKKTVHSIKDMSESLRFSVKDSVHAIETLEKLGILRKTELGYRKVLKYIFYPHQGHNSRKSLEDHMIISLQILNRMKKNSKEKNFYRSSFVATNENLVQELTQNIDDLLRNFLMASEKAEKNSILALSISGVEAYLENPPSEVKNEAI